MKIPMLNTFCGCFSLRNGSKIIGWLSLVLGMMYIAGYIMLLFATDFSYSPNTDSRVPLLVKVFTCFIIVSVIVSTIEAVSGFILLLGAYQAKAKLVYLWVIANIVAIIWNFISGISLAGFIFLVAGTWWFPVGCVMNAYFILVVYSYYREIQNSPVYPV